jgi:hypothetical protein
VRLTQGGQFGSAGRKIYAATTTAVAYSVVGRDIRDVANVRVVNDSDVDVRNPAVVVELVVIPVSAVVAAPNIAVSVVHAAIVADVMTPIALVPAVAVCIIAPVSGGP